MSFNARKSLIIAAVLLLSACNTVNSHIGDEDAAFGEAMKYDQAIQTINPDPVYAAGSAQPGSIAAKTQPAVKRYRTDAVKPVETMQTSSGGTGSGSTSH
jgi:hypothetical protein